MTDRDALVRAGIRGRPPTVTEVEHEQARQAELDERGARHGLTADEVEMADSTGTDLARYAAMKNVKSPQNYIDAIRSAS